MSSTPVPRQTIKSSRGRRLLQKPPRAETPIFVHWNHSREVYFRKHKIEIDSLNPFISFFRVLSLHSLSGLRGAQLLAILVVPNPRRGSTVAAAFPRADTVIQSVACFYNLRQVCSSRDDVVPNDLAVDSAGDTVVQLQVHLGDGVVGENGGVRDITCTSENAGQSGYHGRNSSTTNV